MAGYLGNLGRSVLEGLTFNNADEIEAAIRAMAQGDVNRYRQLKAQVQAERQRWADQNPKAALAGEFGGALAPGVVGAFVPGGQGAAASSLSMLPRVARAMAEPVTMAAERFAPRFAVKASRAMPFLDEGLTGVVQSIGSADTMADAPRQIAEDAPINIAGSLGVRVANSGIKKGLEVRRARKGRR